MKNSDFDYSLQYQNWHSDTLQSREQDVKNFLHFLNEHHILPQNKYDSILEIGCGMGRLMLALQENGYHNLKGIDLDESQINVAKKESLNVKLIDAMDFLNSTEDKYDIIYMIDVLEHISKADQLPLLKNIFDNITDDGFIVLSIPNALAPLSSYFRYTDFTHTTSYTDITIKFLLNNAGFKYCTVRPQHKESEKVLELKKPWAKLYRAEFGLKDCILTPNIITLGFKSENAFNKYLNNAPVIKNDYNKKTKKLTKLWKILKS